MSGPGKKTETRSRRLWGQEKETHPYAEAAALLAEVLDWAWECDHPEAHEMLHRKLHYFTRNDHVANWHDPIDVLVDTMRCQLKEVSEHVEAMGVWPSEEWLTHLKELRTRQYQMTI